MKRWRNGELVRIVKHSDPRAVGLVFRVESFSSMDFLEDHPVVLNPFRNETGQPTYLRCAPDELERATALDQIVQALDGD